MALYNNSPEELVGVPAGLTELTAPANLLSIQREVLCNPQHWVRPSFELSLAELLRDQTGSSAETQPPLRPGIRPVEPLVVVYFLAGERPLVRAFKVSTETLFEGHLLERNVEPAETDVEPDTSLYLLLYPHGKDVGLVLSENAGLVRVPLVAEV